MGKVVGIDCFKLSKGYGKSIGIYTFAEKIIFPLITRGNLKNVR